MEPQVTKESVLEQLDQLYKTLTALNLINVFNRWANTQDFYVAIDEAKKGISAAMTLLEGTIPEPTPKPK